MLIEIPKEIINSTSNPLFLSGSWVEGYASKTSDIDIFEILEGETKIIINKEWGYKKARELKINNISYEIELLNTAEIDALINKINNSKKINENNFILEFSDFQIIWDIIIGIPLKFNNTFNEIKNYFTSELDFLSQQLTNINILFVKNAIEDIVGLLEVDEKQAYFRSLNLLDKTADVLIANNKILNTKNKWRYKKLVDANEESFQKLYLNMYSTQVDNYIDFSKKIINIAEITLKRISCNE